MYRLWMVARGRLGVFGLSFEDFRPFLVPIILEGWCLDFPTEVYVLDATLDKIYPKMSKGALSV